MTAIYKSIEKLCFSIYELHTDLNLYDNEFIRRCKIKCETFELLFKKYAASHLLFNSAQFLHDSEIEIMENSISDFM